MSDRKGMLDLYRLVRHQTEKLCGPLALEDYVIQSMSDVSPPKWHLAHTTWFFETFILQPFVATYNLYHDKFPYLFNSYYETVGPFFPRQQRGLLSRPTVEEILRYRQAIDDSLIDAVESMSSTLWQQCCARLLLGIHHEQQHQELLLTDIKHIFSINPLHPIYHVIPECQQAGNTARHWWLVEKGMYSVGATQTSFCFDNETPHHRVYLQSGKVCSALVTNGEYREFIDDSGYRRPELWLSDGWRLVRQLNWDAPLYWQRNAADWQVMTLAGLRPIVESEPVCHVSYYEADAYARWRNKRLPTEFEWEVVAAEHPVTGNFMDNGLFHPQPATVDNPFQLYGDVWEWTSSPYTAYPGYAAPGGAIGEYNGKFMSNQMVLRGGSCASVAMHIRPTYRNFFYPGTRWQFMGFRLAEWI